MMLQSSEDDGTRRCQDQNLSRRWGLMTDLHPALCLLLQMVSARLLMPVAAWWEQSAGSSAGGAGSHSELHTVVRSYTVDCKCYTTGDVCSAQTAAAPCAGVLHCAGAAQQVQAHWSVCCTPNTCTHTGQQWWWLWHNLHMIAVVNVKSLLRWSNN